MGNGPETLKGSSLLSVGLGRTGKRTESRWKESWGSLVSVEVMEGLVGCGLVVKPFGVFVRLTWG